MNPDLVFGFGGAMVGVPGRLLRYDLMHCYRRFSAVDMVLLEAGQWIGVNIFSMDG